jgi:hypothetical protein
MLPFELLPFERTLSLRTLVFSIHSVRLESLLDEGTEWDNPYLYERMFTHFFHHLQEDFPSYFEDYAPYGVNSFRLLQFSQYLGNPIY